MGGCSSSSPKKNSSSSLEKKNGIRALSQVFTLVPTTVACCRGPECTMYPLQCAGKRHIRPLWPCPGGNQPLQGYFPKEKLSLAREPSQELVHQYQQRQDTVYCYPGMLGWRRVWVLQPAGDTVWQWSGSWAHGWTQVCHLSRRWLLTRHEIEYSI